MEDYRRGDDIPVWDGKTDSLEELELRVEALLMGLTAERRKELGGKMFNRTAEKKGYAWELARDFDRDKLREEDGALQLIRFYKGIMSKEPGQELFAKFINFIYKDKVMKEDDATRLWTRRRRLHRKLKPAGCNIPESLEVCLFLHLVDWMRTARPTSTPRSTA